MSSKKMFIVFISCCTLFGCGTFKTIVPEDNHVFISHGGKESYCKTIPRIYSGICFDACKLYGEPSHSPNLGSTLNGIPLFLIDIPLSFVTDTIVLPYTVFKQHQLGNISVN
jgi:uncharacterized protein YceK